MLPAVATAPRTARIPASGVPAPTFRLSAPAYCWRGLSSLSMSTSSFPFYSECPTRAFTATSLRAERDARRSARRILAALAGTGHQGQPPPLGCVLWGPLRAGTSEWLAPVLRFPRQWQGPESPSPGAPTSQGCALLGLVSRGPIVRGCPQGPQSASQTIPISCSLATSIACRTSGARRRATRARLLRSVGNINKRVSFPP